MAIAGAALFFQSCGNSSSDAADTDDTSMTATDTMMNDEPTTKGESMTDTAFANKAAISGLTEVELGKLALEKATNAKLKDFASMMVKDHGKENDELKAIAKSKSIVLPATLDQEHQMKMEELKGKSGVEFDKAYAMAMVEGHQKTLDLMEKGGAGLADADLKGFAAKTAPVVKHHLDMITSIHGELK